MSLETHHQNADLGFLCSLSGHFATLQKLVEGGQIEMIDRPGLELELNWDFVAEYRTGDSAVAS